MTEALLDKISTITSDTNQISDGEIHTFLDTLEKGDIRCAYRSEHGWVVDERVKKGILLLFRLGQREKITIGPLSFIEKHHLWPRQFDIDERVRIVPGASTIRRGAHLGLDVIVMSPAYVNIGAFVDCGTLIDSNALVGSCAQIGKRVHISAGVQIGGVIEPIGALPVIVEDDVVVGGNCGIYEGTQIGNKAVIGAGVILTKSTKVFDVVNEKIIIADEKGILRIPEDAVLVPGARQISGVFGESLGLSIHSPLIVKYRDRRTDLKTELESVLRK